MATTTHVLDINLISAQGLIEQADDIPHRRIKTYAVAWVDSSTKLRSRVDRVGGGNPTWNDKFLFKVSPQYLFSETSAVSIEIYAVGMFRDKLMGSVRLLISNFLPTASIDAMKTPAFAARLIRSPSGEFFGTLNIGGMVLDAASVGSSHILSKVSAIGYHDLSVEKHHLRTNNSKAAVWDINKDVPSHDDSDNQLKTGDSLTSLSSSSPLHTVLKGMSLKAKSSEDNGVVTLEKEILFEEEKEEITCINMEQPLVNDMMVLPHEIVDQEVISDDNEGRVAKLEEDVKMIMEENKKLSKMVEMLMVETNWKSTVTSDLSGRMKNLERRLSRRNKQRKPHYRRKTSSLIKSCDAP